MTGRLSSSIGVRDNAALLAADEPTFARFLSQAGYDTAIAGKMHFVGPDQQHGFQVRLSEDIYPSDFTWTKSRFHKMPRTHAANYVASGVRIVSGPAEYNRNPQLDEAAHRASLGYLEARGRDKKPFLLCTSYNAPHEPFLGVAGVLGDVRRRGG